jgi:tetratricopeptide (TPR) repeat protein
MAQNDDFGSSLYDSIFALGRNFLSQGQYDKALIIFDGLVALFPKKLPACLAYGEALLMSGQFNEALQYFLCLHDQFIKTGHMLLGAARAYVMLGRYTDAKRMVMPIIEGEVLASSVELAIAKSIFLASGPNFKGSINEN